MSTLIDDVRTALGRLGALGAIAFNGNSQEILRVGNLASIQHEGLFAALFGGPADLDRLRASLEGQLLPQIWSQGGTDCLVSKLPDGTVFGVFSDRSLDPVSLYRASQEAAAALEPLLRRPDSDLLLSPRSRLD